MKRKYLEIAMENAHRMHGLDCLKNLLHKALVVLLRERLLALNHSVKIAVHELHHHVKLRLR